MSFLKKVEATLKVKLKQDAGNVGILKLKTSKGTLTFNGWRDFLARGEGLIIKEDLWNLEDMGVEALPDNLTVRGCLDLQACPIKALPRGLRVEGQLFCAGTKLETIPSDLKVGKEIYLERCRKLQSLPDNFTCKTLYADGSTLKVLPDNFTADLLSVSDCQLTKWPRGLKVKTLDIEKSPLLKVEPPKDCDVKRLMWIGSFAEFKKRFKK